MALASFIFGVITAYLLPIGIILILARFVPKRAIIQSQGQKTVSWSRPSLREYSVDSNHLEWLNLIFKSIFCRYLQDIDPLRQTLQKAINSSLKSPSSSIQLLQHISINEILFSDDLSLVFDSIAVVDSPDDGLHLSLAASLPGSIHISVTCLTTGSLSFSATLSLTDLSVLLNLDLELPSTNPYSVVEDPEDTSTSNAIDITLPGPARIRISNINLTFSSDIEGGRTHIPAVGAALSSLTEMIVRQLKGMTYVARVSPSQTITYSWIQDGAPAPAPSVVVEKESALSGDRLTDLTGKAVRDGIGLVKGLSLGGRKKKTG
eukprot:gnl/Dysnectes_brevis/5792_a8561_531.p1 GENE.gnl/Dysnectes_brevis/5792_a8561_531~~gnl/Dysnectes_brevis/5792_a8561_531.p1  ORF type:complete len:320 (-),score=51.49 gnl/Dysnectes_brevis/5792_a8561_531:245-1204(-)